MAVESAFMPMLRFGRRKRRPGTMRTITGVRSPQLDNTRDLHLYLPPDYETSSLRYPVLYLQDGQNLFDHAQSFAGAWGANDAADSAARLGYPAIIVGVANTISRLDEYSPFHDAEHGAGGNGDDYVQFLVDTVKPMIDAQFRTLVDPDNTVIGGSSMGALIAMYAFFRRGDVFGAASVQSPAFWFAGGAIFNFVKAAPFHPGRIYMDVGWREGGEHTVANARRMRGLLRQKGYVDRKNLLYVEDWRGNHHEFAWGRRLKKALPFLLELDHR
jgi:predicted alpha/beta superfamily hydrolase